MNATHAPIVTALVAALSLLLPHASAQGRDPFEAVTVGTPRDQLPAHVIAPAGVLTLFADYDHAAFATLTLYLVNRTDQPITVPTQGGDPFLKLEGQDAAGRWERAQSHQYSFCGNSYHPITLPPGQFHTFPAPFPRHGEARPIRYRSYSGEWECVSNVGAGHVDPEAITDARTDEMAIDRADLALLKAWITAPPKVPPGRDVRAAALGRLQDFPAAQSVPLFVKTLGTAPLSDLQYRLALEGLLRADPARFAAFARPILTGPRTPVRRRLLEALYEVRNHSLRADPLRLSKNLSDPDLSLIYNALQ